MPILDLVISGTTFVLTGTMWKVRREIEAEIHSLGGNTSDRMVRGCVLIIASSRLIRGTDGKWSTRGTATRKADAAMTMGAMVYHEKMLQDAISSPSGRCTPGGTKIPQAARIPQTIRNDAPQWNDAMQARLDANLRETSELLASLG